MNDEKTKITVKEAVELTNEKSITIDNIMRDIRRNASNGMNCLRLMDVMFPMDIMKEVINHGFTISQHTGFMGENIIRIGW